MHVWLLRKSKFGDECQGWHQDKLTRITNIIVVNLGGSDNISNNEDDEMGQKHTLMDNNKIQKSEGVNYSGNKEGIVRKEAMEKKNCKQEEYAIKAMKMCGKTALDSGIEIGALMFLKVDCRTHCHAQELLTIVYRFQENSGGILVCCEHGIITHDRTSNDYWVPYVKYRVIAWNDVTFPISNNLQVMRDKVLAGSFGNYKFTPRISFSKYVDIDLGTTSPVKKQRVALVRRDVIRDVDVGRRSSGVTVNARAMEIVIRPLGLFGLLLWRTIGLNVFVI
jgi:hypothetical protein